MATGQERNAVQERLRELFPSCEEDCSDGCKYGCLGWLHRFDPQQPKDPKEDSGSSPGAPAR